MKGMRDMEEKLGSEKEKVWKKRKLIEGEFNVILVKDEKGMGK